MSRDMGKSSVPTEHGSAAMDKFLTLLSDCFAGEELTMRNGQRCMIEYYISKQHKLLLFNLETEKIEVCRGWDIDTYGTGKRMVKAPRLQW